MIQVTEEFASWFTKLGCVRNPYLETAEPNQLKYSSEFPISESWNDRFERFNKT